QRRQHVRVPVADKATLLLPNPAGGEDAYLVDLADLSVGGCAFLHDHTIVEGSTIELRFRVHDGRMRVRAVALESRSTERGRHRVRARFSHVSDADRERLADWVVAHNR